MTPEQFAYWLQGFFELTNTAELTKKQVKMIKEHLGIVFNKVTDFEEDPTNDADSDIKSVPSTSIVTPMRIVSCSSPMYEEPNSSSKNVEVKDMLELRWDAVTRADIDAALAKIEPEIKRLTSNSHFGCHCSTRYC